MSLSMNIHPEHRADFERIDVKVYPFGQGSCLVLTFDEYTLCLHYRSPEGKMNLIKTLAKEISRWEGILEREGKEVSKDGQVEEGEIKGDD